MGFDSHGVKRVSAFLVDLRTGETRDLTEALEATGLERDDVRTGPGNGILIEGYRQVYTSCPG
jgi:hypothetical protein